MYQIDQFVLFPLLCAVVFSAAAEESRPPEIDNSKKPDAWMNSQSRRRPDPNRRLSPEMDAVNPEYLDNLKEADIAKMSLEDPLLKYAYADVFHYAQNNLRQMEPRQKLVLADMRRRGESVSPMLLKLIEENQQTRIESSILWKIEHLGSVRIEPFLEYSRKLLRERPNSTIVTEASGLLARQGTKEDIKLLEWLLTQDPFVAADVTDSLKALRERVNPPQPEIRPERRDKPTSHAKIEGGSPDRAENHSQPSDFILSQKILWLIGGLISVILFGAYRLVRKALCNPKH